MDKDKQYTNLEDSPKMSINKAAECFDISVQAVHKKLKSKKIVCPKIGNKSYLTHSIARELFNIKFEKKVVAFQIVKGGTGKTTCLHNVASCANSYGAKVLLIDVDPQANLTDSLGCSGEDTPVLIDLLDDPELDPRDSIISVSKGMDLVPSRIENVILDNTILLKKMDIRSVFVNLYGDIIDEYDFVFLDCPPTVGTAVSAVTLFADLVVAPLNPDKFSVIGLSILQNEIKTLAKHFRKEIPYKIFLNKFSSNTLLSEKALAKIIGDPAMEGHTLKSIIRFGQELPNVTDESRSLFSAIKKSVLRDDFDQLTKEILNIQLLKESGKILTSSASLEESIS